MTEPVALVTGGARRIGAAIVRRLHSAGFRVVIHCHHSVTQAQTLAAELNGTRKDSAAWLRADLNNLDNLRQLAEQTLQQWGGLTLLVNNASCFYPTPLAEATETQWDDLFGSNLKAPYFLSQALADALISSNGCIVNIADIHGDRPMAKHSIYCIAKAGNRMLTKALALELAPHVRVNGIAPGAILWPEDASGKEQAIPQNLGSIPLQQLGGAQAIADAVLFICGRDNYITGEILTVDGGRSLRQ